jgi:hypothetical protein
MERITRSSSSLGALPARMSTELLLHRLWRCKTDHWCLLEPTMAYHSWVSRFSLASALSPRCQLSAEGAGRERCSELCVTAASRVISRLVKFVLKPGCDTLAVRRLLVLL